MSQVKILCSRSSRGPPAGHLGPPEVAACLLHDPSGHPGVPPLGEGEYWIARNDVTNWLMEGVFHLVSPLDTDNMTEVELTEEQEALLNWLDRNKIQHIRVVE